MTVKSAADRNAIAATVAADLRSIERSFDESMRRVGQLFQTLPEARAAAGLGANVGQRALEAVGEGTLHLINGRGAFVKAHDRFAVDAARLGMDWRTTSGPLEDKGDEGVITSPRPVRGSALPETT